MEKNICSPKILLLVFLLAFFIAAYFYLAGFSMLTPSISHFLTAEIKFLCFFSHEIHDSAMKIVLTVVHCPVTVS